MKSSDAIVDEVRAAREALARESDDNLEMIVQAARARQAKSGREFVTLPPRKTDFANRAS